MQENCILRALKLVQITHVKSWIHPRFYRDRFLCQASDKSHCKPGCSKVDVGDVMSNFKVIYSTTFIFMLSCIKVWGNN